MSVTHPYDTLFAARVEMSGAEAMGHVYEVIHTVMRGIAIDTRDIGDSGFVLEVRIRKRHELALHTGHVDGFTLLLLHAVGTIGVCSAPGGGRCFHCDGTGLARPLWEPAAGQAAPNGGLPTPPPCAEVVPALPDVPAGRARGRHPVETFEAGETVVRRDVHRSGCVWSEQALRVVADTGEALVTACTPGAEVRWPALYAKARVEGDRTVRTEAFDAMAAGEWELAPGVWQETELLLWKPPGAWFSINAFFTAAGLRNWYVNFEHPTRRTGTGFDTFDLTIDLVIDPGLSAWTWKDEDEYAHVRRLGIVTDIEDRAVELARAQVLAMLVERAGPFADADQWASWRWNPAWTPPCLPQREEAGPGAVAASR